MRRRVLLRFALALVFLAVFTLLAASSLPVPPAKDIEPAAVYIVEANSVVVISYFPAPAAKAARVIQRLKEKQASGRFTDVQFILPTQDTQGGSYVAYVGAGTLLKDNYVLSVAHLCTADDEELKGVKPILWVLLKESDVGYEADVVFQTPSDPKVIFVPDYSLLKLRKDAHRRGAKVGSVPVRPGDQVIFSGSVKGTAFFMRYCRASEVQQVIGRDDKGVLHLSYLCEFPLVTVHPAGPGDSGGGVFNTRGEIIGVMFAGTQIASEMYVFSFGLSMLREFLNKAGMGELLE